MIILKLLLAMNAAMAGGSVVPNGGTIVICPASVTQPQIFVNQTAVLDLFEGALDHGYTYKRLAQFRGKNFESAFIQAVRLFMEKSPGHRDRILEQFAVRSKAVRYVTELEDIVRTTSWWSFLKGCTLEQAAVQYTPRNPRSALGFEIQIRNAVWNGDKTRKGLETDQKIALMLHEYLMAESIPALGACAYDNIRLAAGFVLSDQALVTPESQWNYALWWSYCKPNENTHY